MTYIEYLWPVTMYANTSEEEIKVRNPKRVEVPTGCIGFRFFERDVYEGKTYRLMGPKKNVSQWYYVGKRLGAEDLLENGTISESTYREMTQNGVFAVLVTNDGMHIPLSADDKVL